MSQRLRIAIDGAQATGKTTLYRHLESRYREHFAFVPEASRVIAPAFDIRSEIDWQRLLSDHGRLEAFFTQEEAWQERMEQSPMFVVDSSMYMIQAYRRYFGHGVARRDLSDKYDAILFCPTINAAYTSDGFRFEIGRERIEQLYLDVTREDYSGAVYRMPGGDARFTEAERILDGMLPGRRSSR